jgi:SAM-dependent methyltransferase
MLLGTLYGKMRCVQCTAPGLRAVDNVLACDSCHSSYPVIDCVPALVHPARREFTEVPDENWDSFVRMKELAYFNKSPLQALYTHYHRYAARQRRLFEKNVSILDVGTGLGEHNPYISRSELQSQSFVGADLDRKKLAYFHRRNPLVPLVQAEATRLPFVDSSFDIVQYLAVLEHFDESMNREVIAEGLRILKRGGLLIACYPAEGGIFLAASQKVMHSFLRHRTSCDLGSDTVHRHLSGAATIRRLFADAAGLTRVASSYFPFRVPYLHAALFINELYRKD